MSKSTSSKPKKRSAMSSKAASSRKVASVKKSPKRMVDFRGLFQRRVFVIVFLWLCVVASGLSVIDSTHQTRKSVQLLELARRQTELLKIETGQLLLEKSSLAAYSRVEVIADKELKMYVPPVSEIVFVRSSSLERY